MSVPRIPLTSLPWLPAIGPSLPACAVTSMVEGFPIRSSRALPGGDLIHAAPRPQHR